MHEKRTLLQLREQDHFDIQDLAIKSQTTEEVVRHAMIGVPIYQDDAVKILDAYSRMTGKTLTLENVFIRLKFEGD